LLAVVPVPEEQHLADTAALTCLAASLVGDGASLAGEVGTADAAVGTVEIVAVAAAAAGTAFAEAASHRRTGEELVVEKVNHILVAEDDQAVLAWLVLAADEAFRAGEEAHEGPAPQKETVEPRLAEGIVDPGELGLAVAPHVVGVAEDVPDYTTVDVACEQPVEQLVVEEEVCGFEAGYAGLEREPRLTAVELASFRPDSRTGTAAGGGDQEEVPYRLLVK
jgi:hypothetical protein